MTGSGNDGLSPGEGRETAESNASGGFRTADDLLALAAGRPDMMACLQAVAALDLPDCWIGAGFARAPVWDVLHGYRTPTPLGDIDVVFFDPDSDRECEAEAEAALSGALPGLLWSVHNQARMHHHNGDAPYRDTGDALAHWLETPTAVALRLGTDGRPELLAPFGLDDLYGLQLRPTPHARAHRLKAYRERLDRKGWAKIWPKLTVDRG